METREPAKRPETTSLAERKPTPQERFTNQMISVFEAEAGQVMVLTDYQKILAQHLFLKIDAALKEAESKRTNDNPPIVWENVNMRALALDAMNRIQLGLDALLPATIYPIAYLNGRTKKYDLDLRVGYRGKLYYRTNAAIDTPVDIRIELVHATDKFTAMPRSSKQSIEDYDFTITQPFERGPIVGGFAYIQFANEKKNKLITVGKDDFEKSRKKSGSNKFWEPYYDEMCYKTLVHRATDFLYPDPEKVNAPAYAAVEAQEDERRFPDDPDASEPIVIPGEFEETPAPTAPAPEPAKPAAPEIPLPFEESPTKSTVKPRAGQQSFAYGSKPTF